MVMATQTFVTEMQAINSSSVQQVQQSGHGSSDNKTIQVTSSGQTPSIIQSTTQSGQQFIVTISGDATDQQVQEAVQLSQGSGQVIYPSHQYVDGSDNTLYAASNGQMYSDYQSSMYTPVSGTYYQGQMSSGLSGMQGQILTHQGGTYLVQSGTMDGEGHPLTHTTRASPATNLPIVGHTVQWLIENFDMVDGTSMPRATLYALYNQHCAFQKLDPMNRASFGKLIRSVFVGLQTRRLGGRGNSKYHYYGIRIKATSPLNQFSDDQTMAMRQTPSNQKRVAVYKDGTDESESSQSADTPQPTPQQHQHQQFLGDASAAIPNFGSIDPGNKPLPDGVSHEHLRIFEQLYKEHSEAILEVVVNLQFNVIEHLWQQFWRNSSPDTVQNFVDFSGETAMEMRLPKDKLYAMCRMEAVQKHVRRSDYAFYQALVEVLIPDVLRPIPSSLTQAIRNFAKSLESWLKTAMVGVPDEMMKTKVSSVGAFAQTLRRYTSLNHLAQAARAVLQNTSQINQMLTDLNRVDFVNVQEQASWVCQCEDSVVHQLEQDFKKTLQQQNSLEQWAIWLESVVNQVLKPYEGTPNFPKAARQFLLKWSFYSSMVIRDLTLRSAASFGSFHLIRLLYDEYMFYLVERKVSAATGETPIAVMGEFAELGGMMSIANQDSDSDVKSESSLTQQHITTLGNNTITLLPASSATMASTSALNHTMASSFTNNSPTTVTVLTGAHGTPKTIVVVPVSSSGDGPTAKRVKMM